MKKKSLKFLEFENENAWMEKMKGERWENMIHRENSIFQKKVGEACSIEELAQKQTEFKEAKQHIFFEYKNILLEEDGSYEKYFIINNKKQLYTDIDIYNNKLYYISDVGSGSLKFRFNAPSWYIDSVGDTFFIKNSIIYLLRAEKRLWYNSLVSYNLHGKFLKEIYIEKDHTYNLSIVKGENDCLFLIRENSETEDLLVVEDLDIIHSNNLHKRYYPIGYYNNKICYFYYDDTWKLNGATFKHSFKNNIVYANLQYNIIILKEYGKDIVYNFSMKKLFSYYGSIHLHPFSNKIDPFERFYINTPDKGVIEMNKFEAKQCKSPYSIIKEHSVNKVHYILLNPLCKMKGVIIVGYGAYGISTSTSTARWKPYLEDGWGIVFAFIRGGGDVDYEWEVDAKTYNKVHSVEDFELVIKDVQKKYNISSKHTCIFGRSAGGYLVGSTIARNPKGDLFKIAYTEVPYVDILNTTTNPTLPLTELEYKEFGNPQENIYEFQKILELSPIDTLTNPPDIFVLIRTSNNDTQVYAYESFKWLYKLRGNSKYNPTKLLSLTKNSGHFVIGDTGIKNFSEDFFLLKSFRDND